MRTPVYPGTPVADAKRRQVGRGFWLPSLSDQGVLAASSSRANVSVASSVTAHTIGTWQEIVAATTKDVHLVTVMLLQNSTFTGATNTSTLMNLSIGTAGHETDAGMVIVANLAFGYRFQGDSYTIPVFIPAGSRLSCSTQTATTSTIKYAFALATLPFGRRPANHVVTMGADTSTSHGVGLAAPSPINTKTAWTQIVASTTEPFGALVVGEQANADTTLFTGSALLDIGVGSAGNEVIPAGCGDLAFAVSSSEYMTALTPRLIPVDVPLGSRLSARWSADNTGDSMDIILYGIPRQ